MADVELLGSRVAMLSRYSSLPCAYFYSHQATCLKGRHKKASESQRETKMIKPPKIETSK